MFVKRIQCAVYFRLVTLFYIYALFIQAVYCIVTGYAYVCLTYYPSGGLINKFVFFNRLWINLKIKYDNYFNELRIYSQKQRSECYVKKVFANTRAS